MAWLLEGVFSASYRDIGAKIISDRLFRLISGVSEAPKGEIKKKKRTKITKIVGRRFGYTSVLRNERTDDFLVIRPVRV